LRSQYVGTITFEHIRRYVDDVLTVTEDEILRAVKILSANPQTIAEPSGAVAPAAWLFHSNSLPKSSKTVAVISGGNIDPALLKQVRAG
jgi:threonine dehydratase